MQVGKVEKVTLLSKINDDLDYLSVEVDFDEIKVFGKYTEILDCLGKYVFYSTAQDMYHGEIITRAINFYEKSVIQTVDKKENIKLYTPGQDRRYFINFDAKSIKLGESMFNCTALFSSYVKGQSDKASWADCSMTDMFGKVFTLRIFTTGLLVDVDSYLTSCIGHYVKFNAESTKYGLQTDKLELINSEVVEPPEVEIAASVIEQAISADTELCTFVESTGLIHELRKMIHHEPGYHLVELAAELLQIETLCSTSDIYDQTLLVRAAVTSKSYLLPSNYSWSKPMKNVLTVMKSNLKNDRTLIMMLDVDNSDNLENVNYRAFYRLKNYCHTLMLERRGLYEETASLFNMSSFDAI